MRKSPPSSEACPCGSGDRYPDCCGALHAGTAAATAEALMRSRYTAYVRGDADYLRATWHPDTRPDPLELDPPGAMRWLGLEIRHHHSDGDTATVEFVARYRVGGNPAARLHEISRFRRIDGRWYHLDGRFPERGDAG